MTGKSFGGFTLVELVTTLSIMAVLTFVALPRLDAIGAFDEKTFRDQIATAIEHARRMAMAARRHSCVNVTAGTGSAGIVEVRRDTTAPESVTAAVSCTAGGGAALPLPGRAAAANNQVSAPRNVTLNGSSLVFDPQGRLVDPAHAGTVAGAVARITVSGQPDITIHPETGYVQ